MNPQPTVEKPMTANDAIIHMLIGINNNKKDLFYQAAEKYVSTLSTKGDIYSRIRRLINEKPAKFKLLQELPHDVKSLIIQSKPADENVFLNDSTQELINELLLEWKNADAYKYHNLPTRNKILFHGSTGNGKTTIARHISKLIDLPFVEVKSDNVVGSLLGSSGSNIQKVFNQINEPCVLFWDEIDTVGRKRGNGASDNSASMENERMVNSILVNLEKLNPEVIFIAATNRKEILDTAFLRRFDVKFELPLPTESEKIAFIKQMKEYHNLTDIFSDSEVITKCDSYSEIKQFVSDKARRHILSNLIAITNEQ